MKKLMLFLGLITSANAFGAYVYCGDKVDRVQIEGGQYLVFLKPESGSTTPHNIGAVGDVLADKYYAMALTAFSMQKPFILRYSDPTSTICSELRFESQKISYVTVKN